MRNEEGDRRIVELVADQDCLSISSAWFYGDSIGFEGLLSASRMLCNPIYEGFVWGYGRGAMARDSQPREMDNSIPGKALVEIALARQDDRLLQELRAVCEALSSRPQILGVSVSAQRAHLKSPYGGEALDADERELISDPGSAIYVDCLHFEPVLFTALGVALGDRMLVEEGIRQAIAFIDLLQDPSTGLFRHFYLERTGRAYVDSWSRGQGWALLGLLDCLEVIGETIDCSRIRASVSDLITALISSQRPNGHWGSLTQDSLSSDESSAAAFFVSGLLRALRLGIVDESVLPVVRRAWSAVVDSTDPNGVLRGVSAAVYSSTRESHYRNVPLDQLVPWGQGPWLVAREEIGRYNNAHEGSEGSISVGEGLLMEGNTRD